MVFSSKSWSGLALALLSSGTTLSQAAPTAGHTNHLFSFGDSYTATGFKIDGVQPSVSGNPLGNPDIGKGTTAGGPTYPGYLATKYKPANYPLLAYDLAVSGATISQHVEPSGGENGTNTFERQVREVFKPKYSSQRNKLWTSEDTIFSIFIGINDIGRSVANTTKPTANATIPRLLDAYFNLADELYDAGARRFLFIAVPPTDRTPMVLGHSEGYQKTWAGWVTEYNRQLAGNVANFRDKYANKTEADKTSVVYYDYHRYLSLILDKPTDYGFTNATCINKDGKSCVWWNGYHVSTKVDDLLSAKLVPAMSSLGWDGKAPKGGYFY